MEQDAVQASNSFSPANANTAANKAVNTAARLWMLLPMTLLLLGSADTGVSSGDRVRGSGSGTETIITAEPWTGQAVLPVRVHIPVVEDIRVDGPLAARRSRNAAHTVWSYVSAFMATGPYVDSPAVRRHLLQVYRC